MGKCWADCLGNCSSKQSREHLVSESIFPHGRISVQGFSWCLREAKDIGISGLTGKILCEEHNNRLSPVDQIGCSAFDTFKEIRRLANVRKNIKPGLRHVVRYTIDGPMLERWFLKTLINLSCDKEYPIGRESLAVGRPSEQLVRVAYGLEQFKDKAGLYCVMRAGMRIESTDTNKFLPLIKSGHHIEGGVFVFRGQQFLLFLEPEGPPHPLPEIHFENENLSQCILCFHDTNIQIKEGKHLSQVLTIEWPRLGRTNLKPTAVLSDSQDPLPSQSAPSSS
ncbi:MAG TPA: hypothetical protein VKU19_28530 [Bryobacteraceae bacterium]|nr:hypothetical protein [Bryobacteraceae bacterium]